MKQTTGFLGTYFDREVVFRLERWIQFIAWGSLAIYLLQAGYNAFQTIYSSLTAGFPFDWYFLLNLASQVVQGGMLFVILQAAAQILLILLEIEENTRRAARTSLEKEK